MKVLLIAPPGAGKGTQGAVIAEHFGIPHIATGDVLRDHVARGTELGRRVQDVVARGDLVPDDVVVEMVRQALEGLGGRGYVLDGVPRTMAQAHALFEVAVELDMTADVALHLEVDDAALVQRLLERAAVQGRSDDTEDVIRRRIALYHEVTQPVLAWYAERQILVSVDAGKPLDEVSQEVIAALEQVRPREDPSGS
jgi:adenylate kinase